MRIPFNFREADFKPGSSSIWKEMIDEILRSRSSLTGPSASAVDEIEFSVEADDITLYDEDGEER